MINTATTDQVQKMMQAGAQVVEVLPKSAYEEQHIAGAISLPLTRLTRDAAEDALSSSRPIIVYCHDTQ